MGAVGSVATHAAHAAAAARDGWPYLVMSFALPSQVLQSVWSRPCGLVYRWLFVLLVGQDALVHLGR